MSTCVLLVLLSLAACVKSETSYLRRLSDVYNPDFFSTSLCGSYRTECVDRDQEKHMITGKAGEYPSKFAIEYTKYSEDICYSGSLLYTITVSGPMSNHKTISNDTFSVDININKRTIVFSQAATSIECEDEYDLNKEYDIADIHCTMNGEDIYNGIMDMGVVSKTISLTDTYIYYDNNNSTTIPSLSKDDQCEALPVDDSPLIELGIWLGALFVIAIIGMIIISCLVEKNDKKKVGQKTEEAEEYSDYSDYSDEEEKTEEAPKEEKTEEAPKEEKTEEAPKEEKTEEAPKETPAQ